ncbi:DUF7159 family protein [Mycolicibacterium austroafricanum]|uniref:DUF7159 family protein n=1 Tax=Mycolicibacterium austroafricanum TaxID=39687 RepID=UPI001CA352D9|nr:hypothetical protein [Mycolicibacterium austroafricanum]QZT57822.1 hypothetical protein JN084_04180 [Mycolicibacterium austroafricanum]
MDLVLGLSMTASSIRWVLVDGATGEESVTIDRGSAPVDDAFQADALLDRLLGRPVHAIGLTWTVEAERTASAVWQGLTDRGVENVIAVSDVESAEALACGIADLAGCERVVVGLAEPGTSVIAAVTPDGVTADRVDPAALTDVDGFDPDAIFVLGSGDVAGVVSALEQRSTVPVVSADEADLALARGAALASASAVSILDAQATPARRRLSPTATLASVLATAVVTFVVSLSVALGMTLTPDSPAPQMARAVTEPTPEPVEKPVVKPAPVKAAPPEPEAAPPPPAAPPVAEPVAVEIPAPAAPALPEAPPPVYDEPLAPPPVVAPAPAYVPPPPPANYLPPAPAAPAYVPPAQVPAYVPPAQQPAYVPPAPQQPRLRDRIIERIPIINRFHEPEY